MVTGLCLVVIEKTVVVHVEQLKQPPHHICELLCEILAGRGVRDMERRERREKA